MPEFGPQSWVGSLITRCYLFVIITRGYEFVIITCGYVFATVIYRRIFQSVMKKNKSEGCNKANIERDEMIFRDERVHLPNPEILACSMLTTYSWLYYTPSLPHLKYTWIKCNQKWGVFDVTSFIYNFLIQIYTQCTEKKDA